MKVNDITLTGKFFKLFDPSLHLYSSILSPATAPLPVVEVQFLVNFAIIIFERSELYELINLFTYLLIHFYTI